MNGRTKKQKKITTRPVSFSNTWLFSLFASLLVSPLVTSAGGVIEDAPRLSTVGLNVLNFLLSILGILGIIAIIVAGVFYLTSGGNEKQISKSKKALVYAIIGIAVTLAALIIVKTIARLVD